MPGQPAAQRAAAGSEIPAELAAQMGRLPAMTPIDTPLMFSGFGAPAMRAMAGC